MRWHPGCLVTLSLGSIVFVGCGARTDLAPGTGGAGSGVNETATTVGPTSSSSGVVAGCTALRADEPIAPLPFGEIAGIDLGLLPDGAALVAMASPFAGGIGRLRVDAFGAWPPSLGAPNMDGLDGVRELRLGAGPNGPVGYGARFDGSGVLASSLWPTPVLVDAPISNDGASLFVAASSTRTLFGHGATFGLLETGSYRPGGLPQTEQPLVCVDTPVGDAVVSGTGFLAAVGRPNPPEPACATQVPQPPTVVTVVRYEERGGVALEANLFDSIVSDERMIHILVAPTSFGAWVVYQTDGSLSETTPGLRARRVRASGMPVVPNEGDVVVSPDGLPSLGAAAASMGDALVVAYVDDKRAVVVQRIEPDGSVGPSARIQTGSTDPGGRLRMISSAAGNAVLVGWVSPSAELAALARFSCVLGT